METGWERCTVQGVAAPRADCPTRLSLQIASGGSRFVLAVHQVHAANSKAFEAAVLASFSLQVQLVCFPGAFSRQK